MKAREAAISARAGFALDRVLGFFAPGLGRARMASREQFISMDAAVKKRMYAAARPTDDAGGWIPYDGDVNSLIRSSSHPVRARVRQLVRDFPYAKRAQKLRNALIIGNGIRMQARVKNADGELDQVANAAIENAFAEWAQKADITEQHTFADLQALADRQLFECGEYFFIKRYLRGKKHPLRLQPIEPDRLPFASYGTSIAPGCDIESGIEYEKATGRRVAYHFLDDGYAAKTIRIPADLVIHGYEMERPGQMRGISPIASAVMVAGDLSDLLESELEAMRMASRYVGFLRTNDLPGFQAGVGAKPNGKKGKTVEHLDYATIQYLRQGDDFTLAKVDRQSGTFEPFIKFNLRTFSVGAGLTYELISGDYDKISYSNLKGIRLDLGVVLRPIQRNHINWLCRPASSAWLEAALLTDRAVMPYAGRLSPSCYAWIPQGLESPDRQKDVKADADEIRLGVNSPQRICASRGVVFEEMLDEIAEAQKKAAERGVTLGDVVSYMKNNPAALEEQDGVEKEE